MSRLQGWGFLSLMTSMMFVTLSLTIVEGAAAIAMSAVGVVLAMLSGLFYMAGTTRPDQVQS